MGHRGDIRQSWGRGLGARRRCRVLHRPDRAARADRRVPRRRAARRAVAEAFGVAARRLRDALGDYQSTRDRLCGPLFDVVDRIVSHEWDEAEITRLLSTLTSVMTDEVEAIAEFESVPT